MLRAVILIIVFAVVKGDGCVQHWVDKDRMVCVCNSMYCDNIDESRMLPGQFQMYVSTKSGKRLQFSTKTFSNGNECDMVLTVDSTVKYQAVHGFGGAMTDATALNLRTLSNKTQEQLLGSYFSPKGIGYTYCRIPIAGTDFSTRPYTYDDVPGDVTLSNFRLVEEDDYKIDYLHQIKRFMSDPSSLRIFTTSWTAPAWMKTSNDTTWGLLKDEYYQLYADYIRKFFDEYRERGIEIWGITPGNEPLDGTTELSLGINAMGWHPEQVATWSTDYLIPSLSKANYFPVPMALDDQRTELPWYIDKMFANGKANMTFKGIAMHWYTDLLVGSNRLTELHEKYPDKFIMYTEACTGSNFLTKEKVLLGSWERAEEYLLNIIEDFSNWVVGWVDWNMALNEIGGPNWAKNFVDSSIIVNATSDEFFKQPMFYALAHISKFVPRDSRRIDSFGIDNQDICTVAFLTPDNKVVTIIMNKSNSSHCITVENKYEKGKIMNLYLEERSFTTLIHQL